MNVEIYPNPTMLDLLVVASQIPEDEKHQIEAMSGYAHTIDGTALACATKNGPKFKFMADGKLIAVCGFEQVAPGVWHDWMMNTPEAFGTHWFGLSRRCRRLVDDLLAEPAFRRIQCYSMASREAAHKWYRVLGYKREGVMAKWAANGEDVVVYARTK
jgi:RimJ/RimL family protein N-acetyltransferase